MRRHHVATAVLSVAAGLAARAVLRRVAARRRSASVSVSVSVSVSGEAVPAEQLPAQPAPQREAVVLPFAPRAVPVPVARRAAGPARCGDSGGRTKAGAPCGARAANGGRCHHHPIAA